MAEQLSGDEGSKRQNVPVLAIAERAGRLRRHVDIRTPDALIAATALEHKLTLVTKNVRHFRVVPGLRVVSPDD